MNKITKIKSKYYFFDIFELKSPKCPLLIPDTVIIKESMWAYPRENSAKEMMRLCYNDVIENKGPAASSCEYAEKLHTRFEESKMYAEFIDALNIDTSEFDVEEWISNLEIEEIE